MIKNTIIINLKYMTLELTLRKLIKKQLNKPISVHD